MKTMLAGALGVLVASAAANADVIEVPSSQKNFIACPIVMDTLDVPCWVADYEGERYFLTVQTGRGGGSEANPFSPMMGHQVLVEGTVSDEPRICGGIVLRQAKLSPLEDVTPNCGKIVPGEGYRVTGPRPTGPDGDPPGDRVTTAVRYVSSTAPATREERAAKYKATVEAREPRDFTITYFFNSNYLPFPLEQRLVDEAAQYAEDTNASRVEIVGYRGATILSNGDRVEEKPGLSQARAEKIAEIFDFFEIPRETMKVSWNEEPEHAGGVRDFELRRATIKVIP